MPSDPDPLPARGRRPDADFPSQVRGYLTLFDRIAESTDRVVSRAPFFVACIATVLLWAVWGPFAGFSDSWQLVINTGTTIVTFLMVALLQNSSRRTERALHQKLNAIAQAMAHFMEKSDPELKKEVLELHESVGLEHREPTD